ncbi:hypothetical protein [Clostridium fallax]|uniref:Uncharacterized protein n=1 Tax=Clostridium fallax TaxID=1533 RepID=A0A1M4YLN8_9CLOT|nr:hypothetical protein [Clostridium fallax]SHF06442.1 hypothetical protein SAMN05443638_1295 [Clostridium fallax]SQB06447.1 Uncharacterised protein [Clostridium fallax]
MYIAFGNRVVDSKEIKELIENNSDFKILKDMSKGSKREDIVAFNMSLDVSIINEEIMESCDLKDLNDDELFDEYLSFTDELAVDIEEILPSDAIVQFASYKWDKSENNVKAVVAIANYELGEGKLKDVMRRLLTQVE